MQLKVLGVIIMVKTGNLQGDLSTADLSFGTKNTILNPLMNLLTMVSHELRTPLTAILGYADIINTQGIDDPKELKRCVEVIQKNAICQAQVINDLIDASSIMMNHLNLDMKKLDLLATAEKVIERHRDEAEHRNISIQLRTSLPNVEVVADPTRLEQIIDSLLSNAVKFSHPWGKVTVVIDCSDQLAVVKVRDKGIGISGTDLQKIFGLFVQADSSLTRRYGGLGLGLPITRYLVEAHGGTIAAESFGLGHGSQFQFTIPLSENAEFLPQ
ncbi:MAG: HAMP domain-containing histidine kinase [Proteobacteria bacterium]|nr:MAG: HAMP domain-containing histidine kinase [Pseudomonadota bacterium]